MPWCSARPRSGSCGAAGGQGARGDRRDLSTARLTSALQRSGAVLRFPISGIVLQWGNVPYCKRRAAKAFGFKASLRAASKMRERLKSGPVKLKVDVKSTFYDEPSRFVVAEIPGTMRPDERIVMVAHIQEPGANDDGSGCGTLLALVLALHKAIAANAGGAGFLRYLDRSSGATRIAAATSG